MKFQFSGGDRMKLEKLIKDTGCSLNTVRGERITDDARIRDILDTEITDIVNDSRHVTQGCLFFCISGAVRDGHDFAGQVIADGARVLVVTEGFALSPEDIRELEERCGKEHLEDIILAGAKDTRLAMAIISAHFYGDPASRMKIIGVTGTKGKTTTTYLIRSALLKTGRKAGLIGTIETLYGDVRIPSANTTPESIVLQKTFRDMADAGVDTVVMEVSSQALKLNRTAGFMFDIGVFTNLSPDHIGPGEHEDFEDYLRCKSLLFRQCRQGVVNMDDPYAEAVLEGHTCDVFTYSAAYDEEDAAAAQGPAKKPDLYAIDPVLNRDPAHPGISFGTKGVLEEHFRVSQPGKFSVYNALCAISVCWCLGIDPGKIPDAIKNVNVRGRVEIVPVSSRFTLLIDYAHNAVALKSLLETLREYEPGRLVCLFGCGGNRSKERRYEMGEVSGTLADLTIITSDNPRFEEPLDIIKDIITGIEKTDGKYVEIPDRTEAVRYALKNVLDGDIIVLAGKGHEDYQEIRGVKYPMDEREIVERIVREEGPF